MLSRREEQKLYIKAKEKLQNMGIPCSTTRSVITSRVAGYLLIKAPADPLPMLEAFIKPPEIVQRPNHFREYKPSAAMRLAALKSSSQPSLISINSRIKHYVN